MVEIILNICYSFLKKKWNRYNKIFQCWNAEYDQWWYYGSILLNGWWTTVHILIAIKIVDLDFPFWECCFVHGSILLAPLLVHDKTVTPKLRYSLIPVTCKTFSLFFLSFLPLKLLTNDRCCIWDAERVAGLLNKTVEIIKNDFCASFFEEWGKAWEKMHFWDLTHHKSSKFHSESFLNKIKGFQFR